MISYRGMRPKNIPLLTQLQTHITHKKWPFYFIAIILYLVVAHMQFVGFSEAAQKTLAVFAVASFLWITNSLPIAVTGIVVLFLLPVSGALTAAKTYSYFGNPAVFFILGALILASPVMRSGLSTRIAVGIISRFGKGPTSLLFSLFSLSALLSFIMSEHAVAAMLYPIVVEVVNASKVEKGSRFGFAAFISMAWGSAIGGTATLLGGARAPLAIGILQSSTKLDISFVQWTLWVFPAVLIILAIAFTVIFLISRNSSVSIEETHAQVAKHYKTLGPLTAREIYTLLILGLTIILWVFYGHEYGLDVVAFFGVILAFTFRVAHWKEVEKDVQWSIVVMYGSAIALGAAMRDTGGAAALVNLTLKAGLDSPFVIFMLLCLLALVLTEAMSNAASVAVLLPIGIALGQKYNIDPRAISVAVATCAGLAFMLPVSTPAVAIISDNPYVKVSKLVRWGALIKLFCIPVLVLLFLYYWPMFGLNIG